MSNPILAGGPYCQYIWCHHRPDPPAYYPAWQILVGYVALGLALAGVAAVLYMLPAVIATWRRLPGRSDVIHANLFWGWTVKGWILALADALAPKPKCRCGHAPNLHSLKTGRCVYVSNWNIPDCACQFYDGNAAEMSEVMAARRRDARVAAKGATR